MKQERLMKILLAPHVSEKTSMAAGTDKQFAFKVLKNANKPEIKNEDELMFDVKVDAVNVENVKGKVRRFGGAVGKRSDWKKAYVKLMPGHDIDFSVVQ